MVRFISDPRAAGATTTTSVPLRVAAVGCPRCATSSIQEALEILGFGPCLHMANVLPNRHRQRILDAACRLNDDVSGGDDHHHVSEERRRREKRQALLRELLHGHPSVADFPGTFFYEDLIDMAATDDKQGLKVILNKRPRGPGQGEKEEAESWSVTARESFGFFFSKWFALSGWMFEGDRLWYAMNMRAVGQMTRMYGVKNIFDPELYLGHNERVLEVCKQAKKKGKDIEVLEFSPDMGWGPLCEFLGVGIPMVEVEVDGNDGKAIMVEREFPRLNERKTFRIVRNIFIAKGVLSHLALGFGIWASWRFGPSAWRLMMMKGTGLAKRLL